MYMYLILPLIPNIIWSSGICVEGKEKERTHMIWEEGYFTIITKKKLRIGVRTKCYEKNEYFEK